jgi:hypothetical protein
MRRVRFTHKRKRFLHLSEGETDKHIRQLLSKFSRYCSLYHCQLNFISCTVSDRVINSLSVVACCQNKLFVSERKAKQENEPTAFPNEVGIYTDKTIYYTASKNEMSQSSCSARDMQVNVVASTDLLTNL